MTTGSSIVSKLFATAVIGLALAACPFKAKAMPLSATDLPFATVFYRDVASQSIKSKVLNLVESEFVNSINASLGNVSISSVSHMSLNPAPYLSLTTDVTLPSSPFFTVLGDNAGFNYSFGVSSALDVPMTVNIDYSYSLEFEDFSNNGYALARIGVGSNSENKSTGLGYNVLNLSTGQDTPVTHGSFQYNIMTNTVYDIVMRADTFHGFGTSKATVMIDPVISIVGGASSDYQLLISDGAGNMPTAATPEPGTMILMGIGAAGVAFMQRRRNAKASVKETVH